MWNNLLKNRVAVITGAASGMGRASAVLFARHGAKVLVADVNETQGQRTVETIQSNGGDAIFVHTDVSSDEAVSRMAQAAIQRWGGIDILFT